MKTQGICCGRRGCMKIIGLTFLFGFAAAQTVLASPEFAYPPEKWASLRDDVLEYEELADLIHEYNAEVINSRLEYDDYRGKSNDDFRNTYSEMADRLEDSSDRMMDGINEDEPGYGAAEASAMSIRLQAELARDQADMENEDGRVKKLEYDRQEALLIQKAQGLMIEYWKKEKERPVLEGTLQQAEAEVQTARRKAALGMLSQPELLEAEAAVCTAQAAEASGKTKQEELRRQLIVMTGWQYDDLPRLREIPIPEEALLEEDPESDRTQALAANFSLAADRRRLENTDSGTAKDVLNQKVEAGQQKIEADIEAKYNSLMQAQTDYGQAKEEYRLAEEKLEADERRYQLGLLSANDRMAAQAELSSKKAAWEISGLSFRQAYEDYQWAVEGLAAYEG